MPFNGSGVYTAPAADFPVVTQTVISSTHFNNTINDIATALSTCLTKDGQQTATANIPFGGFRATNVGITAIAGSVGTPAINVSDAATGLYRSAASELAVTVAGTQRARFDGTGLIVTGVGTFSGATSTTTLTASTSVVTPLVTTGSAVNLGLGINGASNWIIPAGTLALRPTADNTQDLADPAFRIRNVFTPIIDSGTTGSLSLKTNNGTEQARVIHTANAVNFFGMQGGGTGAQVNVWFAGGDANVQAQYNAFGTGAHTFTTGSTNLAGAGVSAQFQVLHTASSTRNITVTGSNGGNPTISTTAGSLAITPAVVVAGASLQVGTTPAVTGHIGLPYSAQINTRNSANSADIVLLTSGTINSITDVVLCGGASGSSGVNLSARSAARAAVAADVQAGSWMLWRDTSGATTKLFYNNAGTLMSVALA